MSEIIVTIAGDRAARRITLDLSDDTRRDREILMSVVKRNLGELLGIDDTARPTMAIADLEARVVLAKAAVAALRSGRMTIEEART